MCGLEPGTGADGTFGLPPLPMFSWAALMPGVPSLPVSAVGLGGATVVGPGSAAQAPPIATTPEYDAARTSRAASTGRADRVGEGGQGRFMAIPSQGSLVTGRGSD
jgi:hypothetical protein